MAKCFFCRPIDLSPSLNIETRVNSIIAELFDPNLLITEVGYTLNNRFTIEAGQAHLKSY